MYRLVCDFLILGTLFFITWISLVKILYRNSQCSSLQSQRSVYQQTNHSANLSAIDPRLKLHHFTVLGTHNSYHKRSLLYRYEHSSLEQQFAYGIRQIELDIHLMAGGDLVYHLQMFDDRTNCYCLKDCLQRISSWASSNMNHYPIYLFIEIKQMFYEDFFVGVNGGARCEHFQTLKNELLNFFSEDLLILPSQVQGNQSSLNVALKKQRQHERLGDYTYRDYGWPPVQLSLGKLMPVFIDDVHKIGEKLHPTCEPLADFFFIAQGDPSIDYASVISIGDPLQNERLMMKSVRNGLLLRALLGYDGKQLQKSYVQAKKYGVHVISTDSVQCNNTDICRSVANDFNRTSPVLCNPAMAPYFCNAAVLTL